METGIFKTFDTFWVSHLFGELISVGYCRYHQACQFNNPYRDVEYRGAIEVRDL